MLRPEPWRPRCCAMGPLGLQPDMCGLQECCGWRVGAPAIRAPTNCHESFSIPAFRALLQIRAVRKKPGALSPISFSPVLAQNVDHEEHSVSALPMEVGGDSAAEQSGWPRVHASVPRSPGDLHSDSARLCARLWLPHTDGVEGWLCMWPWPTALQTSAHNPRGLSYGTLNAALSSRVQRSNSFP